MSLLDKASLISTPNAFKASKLYSIVPSSGTGDLDVVRATTATRVNSAGLIESVAINIPRIDYTNGNCPSLLIEPPRTNLLTYSEQFDNAAWTKVRALVTANTTISPDGNQNADTFVSAAGQAFFPVLTRTPSFVGNTSYSLSIFAKVLGNTNVFRMGYVDNATGFTGGGASFDLSTQAITITQSPNSSVTANIQNYGNGWYRLNIKFLTIAIPTFNYLEFSISTNDVGNAFALYGGQLEVGAYPTSYIPTVASTITRNADVISKTGISSLIGQTEGTIFVEANLSVNASERRIITVSNGTESQRIIFWTDGTILYANFNNISVTIGTFPIGIAKIALGYTISGGSTTYSIKLNNNTLITGTSATAPNPLNSINIGANTSLGLILNDRINSVQIYKTRLTNAEITSLTTL